MVNHEETISGHVWKCPFIGVSACCINIWLFPDIAQCFTLTVAEHGRSNIVNWNQFKPSVHYVTVLHEWRDCDSESKCDRG